MKVRPSDAANGRPSGSFHTSTYVNVRNEEVNQTPSINKLTVKREEVIPIELKMMGPLARIVTSALCLLLLASNGVEGFTPNTRAHRGKASSLVRRAETAEAPATTTDSSIDSSAPSLAELPPVIQQIADDRRVYQMQLGKAMDTLRRDMQDILTEKPGTCDLCRERERPRPRFCLTHTSDFLYF